MCELLSRITQVELEDILFIKDIQNRLLSFGEEEGR